MTFRTRLLGLAGLMCVLTVTGCNTVKGVGKDIHDGAQNVQVWMEDSTENKEHVGSSSRVAQR